MTARSLPEPFGRQRTTSLPYTQPAAARDAKMLRLDDETGGDPRHVSCIPSPSRSPPAFSLVLAASPHPPHKLPGRPILSLVAVVLQ